MRGGDDFLDTGTAGKIPDGFFETLKDGAYGRGATGVPGQLISNIAGVALVFSGFVLSKYIINLMK